MDLFSGRPCNSEGVRPQADRIWQRVGIIMLKRFFTLCLSIFVFVVIYAASSSAEVQERPARRSPGIIYVFPFGYPNAYGERSPYGSTNEGLYGQRRVVVSKEDARRILKQYFLRRNVKIGAIWERKFYFEAEIRDRNGNLLDIVLIDKRTGRIRSIY
jgi:hypothetical protein